MTPIVRYEWFNAGPIFNKKVASALVFLLFASVLGVSIVKSWNLFGPADFEACSENAATTAKSKDSLKVLISACEARFNGRRKVGGGYSYFDVRQGKALPIAGPNPTLNELKQINDDYSNGLKAEADRLAKQAEADNALQRQRAKEDAVVFRRAKNAESQVRVTSAKIECAYRSKPCSSFTLIVGVKNDSKETVVSFSVGWTFVSPETLPCPNAIPIKLQQEIVLNPGDTTVLNIKADDGPESDKGFVCVKVTNLEIIPLP
jgi:hypothetical protein